MNEKQEKRVLYIAQLTRLVPTLDGQREEEQFNLLERLILNGLQEHQCFVWLTETPGELAIALNNASYRPMAIVGSGVWGVAAIHDHLDAPIFQCPVVVAFQNGGDWRFGRWKHPDGNIRLLGEAKKNGVLTHPNVLVQEWAGEDLRSLTAKKIRDLLALARIPAWVPR